jgi:dGTPase
VEKVAAEVAAALQVAFTADQAQAVLSDIVRDITEAEGEKPGDIARLAYQSSLEVSKSGYLRVEFTSQLVREFIQGVHFVPNEKVPPLSKVELAPKVREKVEVLKRFNYVSLIMSPRLKIAEFRGGEIVQTIFDTLAKKDGHRLLPDDFQRAFERIAEDHRKRVICDFIAGMTDRYALEFYGRLRSENPQTIFKPL